jgi:hypothetical protein
MNKPGELPEKNSFPDGQNIAALTGTCLLLILRKFCYPLNRPSLYRTVISGTP